MQQISHRVSLMSIAKVCGSVIIENKQSHFGSPVQTQPLIFKWRRFPDSPQNVTGSFCFPEKKAELGPVLPPGCCAGANSVGVE